MSETSLNAARWATEAWVRQGQLERGKSLLEFYRPLAGDESLHCSDNFYCFQVAFEQMALWVGDYATASKAYGNVPFDLIDFDVDHGRGLANLDAHIALADNPAFVDLALSECSERAARRKTWSVAKGCVERLAARVDRPLAPHEVSLRKMTKDAGRPRLSAISAALTLAGLAAGAGELPLSREMTDLGLKLAQTGESSEIPFMAEIRIEQAAIAELRSAKRL